MKAAADAPYGQYFSIDVECVATGKGHNDRAIAQIALVDQTCNCILNLFVKPSEPVTSYLTPLTGVTAELLDEYGMDLPSAISVLKGHLPTTAILVGQNIGKDTHWLALKEGVDYGSLIDLAGVFRVFNEKYKSYTYFGLDHVATVLLGESNNGGAHNAATDAIKSMRLYLTFLRLEQQPEQLKAAQQALLNEPVKPSFARLNPTFESVCMGNRKTCQCGQAFLG